jgi:hypothetical protein
MAKISTYPDVIPPALDDYVIGTDVSNSLATKSFVIADVIDLATTTGQFLTLIDNNLPVYEDNAEAIIGGLDVNSIYQTSTGEIRIVV